MFKPITGSQYWGIDYRYAMQMNLISQLRPGTDCYDIGQKEIDIRYRASPSEIISNLRAEAKKLLSTPLQLYGIELSEKATIGVMGTTITVGVLSFAQMLQIVLAPLLVLWFGSLYHTRYRETLLISSSANVAEIFPHIINVYPAGHYPQLRKPNLWQNHFPKFLSFMYFATRTALVSIFVIPPVVLYLLSLYFLHSDQYLLNFLLGAVVAVFSLAPILVEALPWHCSKVFPGMTNLR